MVNTPQDFGNRSPAVIIPARDAAATLGICLDALRAAGAPAGRMTVVDDGSRDATAVIASAWGVRVLSTPCPGGAAAARNLGAARSEGEVILFVDADVSVSSDAISRILDAFGSETAPDALIGSYDDAPPAPGIVSRVRNLLHHHVHQTNAGPAATFWTGLGAIRRDAFEAVGGFAVEQRMMEDVRLGYDLRRHGYRIVLDPAIQGAHLKRWTLRSMLWTDLFDRALPWSRLLMTRGDDVPESLNVSLRGKLSVAVVVLGTLASAGTLLLAPFYAWGVMAAGIAAFAVLGVLAVLNRDFLGLVAVRLGRGALIPAVLILWLHHGVAGIGYAWATAETLVSRLRA